MGKENPGFVEKAANFSTKLDIVTGVYGLLVASTGIVAISALSFGLGKYIEGRQRSKREGR
jgi:hypothetical protein